MPAHEKTYTRAMSHSVNWEEYFHNLEYQEKLWHVARNPSAVTYAYERLGVHRAAATMQMARLWDAIAQSRPPVAKPQPGTSQQAMKTYMQDGDFCPSPQKGILRQYTTAQPFDVSILIRRFETPIKRHGMRHGNHWVSEGRPFESSDRRRQCARLRREKVNNFNGMS